MLMLTPSPGVHINSLANNSNTYKVFLPPAVVSLSSFYAIVELEKYERSFRAELINISIQGRRRQGPFTDFQPSITRYESCNCSSRKNYDAHAQEDGVLMMGLFSLGGQF